MSEAFTPADADVTDADIITGNLQPDPSLLTEDDICDEILGDIIGDDDESEADGE